MNKGFNSQYGARSLKRSVQKYVEDVLCDFMMEHWGYKGEVMLKLKNGSEVIVESTSN